MERDSINIREQQIKYLTEHGLYDPANEHDACGVGMIAAVDGKPRREVVEAGLKALGAVWHRGAVDADGKSGDGAGLLMEIPYNFFHNYLESIGKPLREDKKLAVGMVFLPRLDFGAMETCRAIIESEMVEMDCRIYGWRQVPVDPSATGSSANAVRPEIEQVMIACPWLDDTECERKLYVLRRRIEKKLRKAGIASCYLCSLSCRHIVYKGLVRAEFLADFYPDLLRDDFISPITIFHQRFSTNTAPAWHLAQPFRCLAHNGEINTVRGNINHMRNQEAVLRSGVFTAEELEYIPPVIADGASDTAALDAVMEVMLRGGRHAPIAKTIMVPPAWSLSELVDEQERDFYNYCNSIMEPWDGPAAIVATDGEWIIAGTDRNGLRPLRYTLTADGLLVMGSETGMVPVEEGNVTAKGQLAPGQIIGVQLKEGKFYDHAALKNFLISEHPYTRWAERIVTLDNLEDGPISLPHAVTGEELHKRQAAAGQSIEDMEMVLMPMAETGKEAIGSMGDDTPLAVLSERYRGLHHYFRQCFSQVTNPPIDSLRERRVMSLFTRIGNNRSFLHHDEYHADSFLLKSPVLLDSELDAIRHYFADNAYELDATFAIKEEGKTLKQALTNLHKQAEEAVREGKFCLILSDVASDEAHVAIPSILAVGAVHTHLVTCGLRKKVALLVRSAECLDVHYFAVLIGVGATAVNAWLAEAILRDRNTRNLLGELSLEAALKNYQSAIDQGLLKIMAKMGISVISSYRGGYNFEALGLARSLVENYFPGMPSRISGIGLKGIQNRVVALHQAAWQDRGVEPLPVGGFYRYRASGETHSYEGHMIHMLQSAVGSGTYQTYKKYTEMVYNQPVVSPRDLLEFDSSNDPIPLREVESITKLRKRFVVPAMSLGALSPEAHETLTIAMNRIGASSNSGEGGEGAERRELRPNGDNPSSSIKQVASGRFGVTVDYLASAKEIQIKVAQGAKPGEGGQLPGFKVTMEIARLRHSTPGVMLISPPPHHDIYSIEDLAQLIYDLKQINPRAYVSVKLVSLAGVGTIASGVAKAMADKIIVSGHSGGTGASALSSLKYAGVPWELGLAEANQVLTLNRLRSRVKLQTDGGIKTGRDVVIAAMLGAEEFAVGTASLVAMGCIMVRQCHSNTCPVGVCTQDEKLRAKFDGSVEKVINLFSFIAEEVREILASLGVRTLNEVIGRTDLLTQVLRGDDDLVDLDLNRILAQIDPGDELRYAGHRERVEVAESLDVHMIKDAEHALDSGEKVQLTYTANNTQRAIGTRLSAEILSRFGDSLSPEHVHIRLRGSAGQSLGAFAVKGLKIEMHGDANDYVGKGLSGATIIVRPRGSCHLRSENNAIIGNTVLYGATSGKLYAAGRAGERFAVRNSGALAVVEGCGSNGCEYMTGGIAVILGAVGSNFAAGMSGGMAYVYDPEGNFSRCVNDESVIYQRLASTHWEDRLVTMLQDYIAETESVHAQEMVHHWQKAREHFWQVCPKEMVDRLEHPLSDRSKKATKKKA